MRHILDWTAIAAASACRRLFTAAAVAGAAIILSACGQGLEPGPGAGPGPVSGDTLGSGSNRVALLLPLSGPGGSADVAKALQNAAELALAELPTADIQLVPIDTRGTAEGAQAGAQAAISGGARLIVGPLFAAEVSAVAPVARSANVPVIGFSSDANVAGPGVYLLSFLPEQDIERIVGYAARQGKRSFAALLPESAYGSIAEAALQQAAPSAGGRVVTVARYGPEEAQMQAAVAQVAPVASGAAPQADALLMPEGPPALATLAAQLSTANVGARRVQFLGSGQWNDAAVWRIGALTGGWFAGPDPAGWQTFQAKYRSRYGVEPPRNATLAYDAVTLAAALSRIQGGSAFTNQTLTNPDGFSGVDGIFRFRQNGTIQRGLAILEIGNGQVRVREPAPRSFAAGG